MLEIQLIGILFGISMLYYTFISNKKNKFKSYYLWIVVWIGFIILSMFPKILDFLIKDILQFSRRLDFFIIIGFMLVIVIVYYLFISINKTKKDIEKIVREIACKQ